MKNLQIALLTLIGYHAVAVMGCATAGPVIVRCGTQELPVALADYNEIKADVKAKNWADLVAVAGRIGYDVLGCALGNLETQSPELRDNAEDFKRLHSVEFRAAGVSAENAPLDHCDATCGGKNSGLATPSGCRCWHAATTGRKAHWTTHRRPAATAFTGGVIAHGFPVSGLMISGGGSSVEPWADVHADRWCKIASYVNNVIVDCLRWAPTPWMTARWLPIQEVFAHGEPIQSPLWDEEAAERREARSAAYLKAWQGGEPDTLFYKQSYDFDSRS